MQPHWQRVSLTGIFLAFLFTGVSCDSSSLTITTGSSTGDSGVYKSEDNGGHWTHKVFVDKVKKKETTIGAVNIRRFLFDPQDSRIVYIITDGSGIWRTVNAAEQWKQIFAGGLGDFAIDHRDPNNLAVASGNTVNRSDDSGTSWLRVYLETRPGVGMNSVLFDRSNSKRMLAATSAGDILVTSDLGATWDVLHRFEGFSASRLLQLPSRALYAVTHNQGLWRSTDQGNTWVNVIEILREKPGAYDVRDILFDPAVPNGLILVTNYGIFRSPDGGETWNEVTLIARPGTADIKSVAVNPVNAQELFYAVPGGLYRTKDGGAHWTTLSLPVGHLPTALAIDWYNPSIMYLGVTKVKK